MNKTVYALIGKFRRFPTYICDAQHYYILEKFIKNEVEHYRKVKVIELEREIKSEKENLDYLNYRDIKAKEHRVRWQNRLNYLNEKYKRKGCTSEEKKSLKKEFKRFETEAVKEKEAIHKSEKKIKQFEEELRELKAKSLEDIFEENVNCFSIIREIPMNENLNDLGYFDWIQSPVDNDDDDYEDWDDD